MEGSKSHVLMLAAALAVTGLAGCIEAPGFLNVSDVEVSALENRGLADEAAFAWNEKATLVSVMAFELTQSEEERIAADPEVGNGLAPAWWYVYCAYVPKDAASEGSGPARGDAYGGKTSADVMPEIRAFKVTADGTVSAEDEATAMTAGYSHDTADLSAWKIDSTEALAKAKTDTAFAKAAEGLNASVVEGVVHHEGTTSWYFAAMSADGFVVATVDAVTGELLSVQSMDLDMTMPTFEWGARDPSMWAGEPIHLEGDGYAAPGEPAFEAPLVTSGAMHGTLGIQFYGELPTDGLHWAILDAEGEWVTGDHVSSWMGGAAYEEELAIEEAGEYTFTLYYMSWATSVPFLPPVGPGGVDYAFSLHLIPGEAEDDEHEG